MPSFLPSLDFGRNSNDKPNKLLKLNANSNRSSALDFSDGNPADFDVTFDPPSPPLGSNNRLTSQPSQRRNQGEQFRLQGLMRLDRDGQGSNQMMRQSTWSSWKAWMVNEGKF